MTMGEVREHSLAQLKLLCEAAGRVRARRGMLDLQVATAGAGAGMGSDKGYRQLMRSLERQS